MSAYSSLSKTENFFGRDMTQDQINKRVAQQMILQKYAVEIIARLGILAFDDRLDTYTCMLKAGDVIPEGWQRDLYLDSVRRK